MTDPLIPGPAAIERAALVDRVGGVMRAGRGLEDVRGAPPRAWRRRRFSGNRPAGMTPYRHVTGPRAASAAAQRELQRAWEAAETRLGGPRAR